MRNISIIPTRTTFVDCLHQTLVSIFHWTDEEWPAHTKDPIRPNHQRRDKEESKCNRWRKGRYSWNPRGLCRIDRVSFSNKIESSVDWNQSSAAAGERRRRPVRASATKCDSLKWHRRDNSDIERWDWIDGVEAKRVGEDRERRRDFLTIVKHINQWRSAYKKI